MPPLIKNSLIILILAFVVSLSFSDKPDFCDETYIDAIFNRESIESGKIKNHITIIRDEWKWTYNSDTKKLSEPQFITDYIEETAFYIPRIRKLRCDNGRHDDCHEIKKMEGLAIVIAYDKTQTSNMFYFYRILNNMTLYNITDKYEMPWNMTPSGHRIEGPMWPIGWVEQKSKPVVYIPSRHELVFIINGRHGAQAKLAWNLLYSPQESDIWWATYWDSSFTGFSLEFYGMFEKDGLVYAVGEHLRPGSKRSEAQIFSYQENYREGRSLMRIQTDIRSFFHCSKKSKESNVWIILLGAAILTVTVFLILIVTLLVVCCKCLTKSDHSSQSQTSSQGLLADRNQTKSQMTMNTINTINSETGEESTIRSDDVKPNEKSIVMPKEKSKVMPKPKK